MFVVPNHLVGQWASEYLRLYPSANILVTTKQDFETGNRKKFCGRIATGDYDAVIIGHSQFEKIPMSVERQKMQLEKQLFDIERGIEDISDLQLSYITNVGAGQGLLKVGSSLVPSVNKFPRNTELYKLMTTKFGEA